MNAITLIVIDVKHSRESDKWFCGLFTNWIHNARAAKRAVSCTFWEQKGLNIPAVVRWQQCEYLQLPKPQQMFPLLMWSPSRRMRGCRFPQPELTVGWHCNHSAARIIVLSPINCLLHTSIKELSITPSKACRSSCGYRSLWHMLGYTKDQKY